VRYFNGIGTTETYASALGTRWRSNYDRYLRIISSTAVTAERADGQEVNFNLIGTVWTPDTDVDATLTNSGTTWTLTDSTDTTETYLTAGTSEALLQTIKARNGYTQNLTYNASNQLTSVADSYNRTLSFTYTGGLLQKVTTPDALVLTYSFNSVTGGTQLVKVSYSTTPATSQTYLYENAALLFSLTGITDEDGARYATWTYDASGRGLTSQHGTGADLTTIAYDDTDGSRTVTNALGEQEVYKFSTFQGVPKVTEIDRVATPSLPAATRLFTYDANGYMASQTDWNGNLTTYVNNAHGEPTTINEAVGGAQARTTTIAYDTTFVHLPKTIVTPGLTTSFTYDASGNPLTKTLTDTTTTSTPYSTTGTSRTWTYTWSNFLPASTQGPRTDVAELTKFTYDASGALTKTTNALNQATQITLHLPGGLPETVIDPNGVTTQLTYDARQRLLSSTVATAQGQLATKYAYDAAGNLLTATLPDGSALTNTYDAAHRLTALADFFGQKIAYTLDALGDRTQTNVSNAASVVQRKHTAGFDALGRVLQDIGGVGQTTAYTYDGNGNALTIKDPLQHTTQQAFDALNRRVQVTDPAGGVASVAYDAHDRITSVTDPNGNITTYVYDGFGDVIQQASPVTGTTVYHYDLAGNLTQSVDANGAIANYTYDALDRVLTTTYPGDSAENVAYTYDQSGHGFGTGRLTGVADAAGTLSRSYDERGNQLSESRTASGTTLLTSYAYDAASRIASITYPLGWTVGYTRDAMGRSTALTARPPGGGAAVPVVSGIGYEPFGPAKALTYGNGVAETRAFDLDYRLTSLSASGTHGIQSLTYGYDAANNVLSMTDGVTSGNSQSFTYDVLNRLLSAAGSYGSLAYTYDKLGNRLTETPPVFPVAPLLDGMGSATTFAYNQAGRLSATMAGAQTVAQYTYDAFGQRLIKVQPAIATTTLFQFDQRGRLLDESNNQANPTATDYIYLDDGRPVAMLLPGPGSLYFLHDDRLGTPQLATGSSQNLAWSSNYQPFGQTSAFQGSITENLRLPGQYDDYESGLYHNGFRDYVPNLGRYVQSDPMGLAGGANTYAYVGDQPLGLVDPDGDQPVAGTIYGAISGGIAGAITGYENGGVWGAVGGALIGGAVGGLVGTFVAPASTVAAQVITDFVVGGVSSYGGDVIGNMVSGCQGLGCLTNNVNPGEILASAAASAIGPVADVELLGIPEDVLLGSLSQLGTSVSIASGIGSGLSGVLGGSLYNIYNPSSSVGGGGGGGGGAGIVCH
jgi:RHS repeat-associated protein